MITGQGMELEGVLRTRRGKLGGETGDVLGLGDGVADGLRRRHKGFPYCCWRQTPGAFHAARSRQTRRGG